MKSEEDKLYKEAANGFLFLTIWIWFLISGLILVWKHL
jgi:hypothetical protein